MCSYGEIINDGVVWWNQSKVENVYYFPIKGHTVVFCSFYTTAICSYIFNLLKKERWCFLSINSYIFDVVEAQKQVRSCSCSHWGYNSYLFLSLEVNKKYI